MEISVNGTRIVCGQGNVTVRNGVVTIDGKNVDCTKDKEIIINGNCNNIDVAGNLTVNGDVSGDVDITGNMHCGNIYGSVDAVGNIRTKRSD